MWIAVASSEPVMFAALGPLRVGGFQLGHHTVGLTLGFNKYPGRCYCNKYKMT